MKKTVIITGGSRGIGAAAVKLFSASGYNVAFFYNKSEEAAKKLAKETNSYAVKADVSNSAEVERAVKLVNEKYGEVDVLVNNAGISQIKLFTDITDEDWNKMLAVNLTGTFNCTRSVAKQMINRKSGSIINISSMWGIAGASCEVHYSASKAAIIGMTKALAKELGPSGIRVNCIAPGVIDTDMNKELDAETLAELKNSTPLEKIGKPEDIAELMLFLASEKSGFITGQTISADGGFIL